MELKKGCGHTIGKIILIFILLWISPMYQKTIHAENPSNLDMTKLDEFIRKEMKRLNIPGVSLAIVNDDQIQYLKGYGISGANNNPMTPQTPIVIGSVSKSFTALAILQLVDRGIIRLEDRVQSYLPWFRLADEESSKEITIKHLLNQTSGLSTYDGQLSILNGNKTLKEHIKGLKNIELEHEVGETYEYSNLNYDILGLVIEEVTNTPYKKYITNNIFKPLNMKNSYADKSDDKNKTIATGYQTIFGLKFPTEQLNHEGNIPSGYLISSAEDMANYMIALLNNGQFKKERVLSKDKMQELFRPATLMWEDSYYAMGWTINQNVISHDGSTENTYTKVVLDGEYGISLLINSLDYLNIDSYDNIMTGIINIIHHDELQTSNQNPYKIYIIINSLLILTFSLISFSLYRTFKPRNDIGSKFPIGNRIAIIAVNFFIPGMIFYYVPKVVPWPTLKLFVPGIGHALFIIPFLLLFIGILKIGRLLRAK